MRIPTISLLLCMTCLASLGQVARVVPIDTTDSALRSTSGAVLIDGALWTHGDSGTPKELVRVNLETGRASARLMVSRTENIDWEEITHDGQCVYIGDVGEWDGCRRGWRVYRIPIEHLKNEVAECEAEKIDFVFPGCNDRIMRERTNNFDCEAMVVVGDSIYLFTKNWGDPYAQQCTDVYALSKVPAATKQTARLVGRIPTGGMLTAAALDGNTGTLALVASVRVDRSPGRTDENGASTILCIVPDFEAGARAGHWPNLTTDTLYCEEQRFKAQVEAIVWANDSTMLMTSELSNFSAHTYREAAIWRYDLR